MMKLVFLALGLFQLLGNVVEALPTPQDAAAADTDASRPGGEEAAANRKVDELEKQYQEYVKKTIKGRYSGCTEQTIIKRQEWGSLPGQDRKDYIKAVKCLQSKPPRSRNTYAPGSRSRFDDFAAIHLVLTLKIHFSGLFFHWHRHFTWLYEQALRNECGYKGAQPYWDWSIDWRDPRKSTVFDASPTSMGGNGQVVPNRGTIEALGLNGQPFYSEPGTGGGCVETGPFAGLQVDLGNVAFAPYGPDGGLGYNPHCLVRDISLLYSQNTRPQDVARTLQVQGTLGDLDTDVESETGVHFSGHRQLGGLQLDPWSSPGDPAFYLHHSSIDRMWTIWQGLDPAKRLKSVFGTSTTFNTPPSPNVTLDYSLYFGDLGANYTMGKVSSAIDGPYCYMYI